MSHDPLCLHFVHVVAGGTACNCDQIAKVRADEREKAAMQVDLYLCSTFVEPRDHIVLYDRILNLIRTGQR